MGAADIVTTHGVSGLAFVVSLVAIGGLIRHDTHCRQRQAALWTAIKEIRDNVSFMRGQMEK